MHFLCSGMPSVGVVVVVNDSAVNNVEGGGLMALCQVDNEEDLINSLCKQNLTL